MDSHSNNEHLTWLLRLVQTSGDEIRRLQDEAAITRETLAAAQREADMWRSRYLELRGAMVSAGTETHAWGRPL